jgi:hypothetical protein
MARELVTHIWCDPCLSPEEGGEPTYTKGEELPAITLGTMKPRVLAMCEVHRKEYYDAFRDLVARLGQVVPEGAAPSAPRSSSHAGSFPCPVPDCPKHTNPYRHDTSLGSHARREHGATVAELRARYGQEEPQGALDLHQEGALAGEPITSEKKPPAITRTECEDCGVVYEWPKNARPSQALGVHRARAHGVKGEGRKDRPSKSD